MKVYNCINCGKSVKYGRTKSNKYCSNGCQCEYRFLTEILPRFKSGLLWNRKTIRKCLIHLIGDHCHQCGIVDWNGENLTFQVDHKNGDPSDNDPDNLQLVCPNCHSQSPYFSGRNKGSGRKARGLPIN